MKTCLLDLDGVLVDFVGGACRFHNKQNPYDDPANLGRYGVEDMFEMIQSDFYSPLGEEFWANLRPMDDSISILSLVEKVFGEANVCILTKPIKTPGCAEGKIRWLKKHLPSYYRGNRYLIGPAKHFCASANAYLVDDSDVNVKAFNEAGGHGVLVPRPWNSHHHLRNVVVPHIDSCLPGYGK